ncbi:MAG: DnaJ domain-containing protein [Cyanobacteria bacterium]|nr:DnaJ domain-containing protein [Cyanobacteriota bacterium]MDA1246100.1 DnaJ domain-containing protein [Cyanobacteriota bacterium]
MTSSPAVPADYWLVLGLEPGSDASNLKRAFRAQARRWHPDLNGNDPLAEERFKLVNEAYAVLSDPRRRQVWEAGMPIDGLTGRVPQDPFASGFPDFEEYLEELFGERRRQRSSAAPEWDESESEPPVEKPYQSSGFVTASPPSPPPVQASSDQESLVELSPEQALQGERLELELVDGTAVEVWTPPLAGDGWRLRLAGVTPGGGDHFLQLRVRTEDGLRIDGLRVLYPLELTPAEAALGCQVVVPTLRGPVKLRVPAGSSSGRLLRLRGRGQEWGDKRGDQLVEVRILVPEYLGEAEAALYKRLQELADDPEDQNR